MYNLPCHRRCCLYFSIKKITPNEETECNVANTHLESGREIKSLFSLLLHIQYELGGLRYTDRSLRLSLSAILFLFAIVRLDLFNKHLANVGHLKARLGENVNRSL